MIEEATEAVCPLRSGLMWALWHRRRQPVVR